MKDILLDVQFGVHTYAVGQPLTRKQYNAILGWGYKHGKVVYHAKEKKQPESYTVLNRGNDIEGIKITLYPIPERQTFRMSIQIEPCRVLGSDDPTQLYRPDKKSYGELVRICDDYLNKRNVPGSIDDMKVSRCDVTANLVFNSQEYVDAYIRILKKGYVIKGYWVEQFRLDEGKAKDPKRANAHSHCICCNQAAFLAYDKVDELEMIGRCPKRLEDAAILRLEAQLKRPALKRYLGEENMGNNLSLLKTAARQSADVIVAYLEKALPGGGQHLRYEDATDLVRVVKKDELRKQMRYLLRKTSDSDNLSSALGKLTKDYSLSKKQAKNVLAHFAELKMNPIILPNNSKAKKLPALTWLVVSEAS